MVELDCRLSLLEKHVRRDKIICDVGTDHALLACYLKETGAEKVIACDINDGPLKAAAENIKQQGISGITLVKSWGLREIPFAEDIIIAGMGGELIAQILAECSFLHTGLKAVLQPMSRAETLRKELYKIGFEIELEETCVKNGKSYVVIVAIYTGIKAEISDLFSICGKIKNKDYLLNKAGILEKRADSERQSCPEKALADKALAEEIKLYTEEL